MKPTEQDIQAELIEGWEISDKFIGEDSEISYIDIKDTVFKFAFSFFSPNGANIFDVLIPNGDNIRNLKYPDFLAGNYDLSAISQHYKPEEWQRIITMCERIVRLITGEQTLEEKVRGWLKGVDDIQSIKDFGNCVEVRRTGICYWVHPEEVSWRAYPESDFHEGMVANCFRKIDEYRKGDPEDTWGIAVRNIAAELSKRYTRPSYSDLEQRVEELEQDVIDLREDRDHHKRMAESFSDQLGDKDKCILTLERENASLLDRFGPIDQAEQQYAVARKDFETFTEKVGRWAQGIIELNEEIL